MLAIEMIPHLANDLNASAAFEIKIHCGPKANVQGRARRYAPLTQGKL